jgi:glutamate 5-kinase
MTMLADAKRIVIKIGSILLVDPKNGQVHARWLQSLAEDVASLRARGQEVILVSSGAIALGRRHLGLRAGKLKLEESQAAAATGQIHLAKAYQDALSAHDISVAQVLLTLDDTEQRRKYLNARSTINTLLRLGAVPVINENDTVATAEIRFGDNDRLSARVAEMTSADCLILLSDVDGLYSADPASTPDAQLVPKVARITAEIEAMAGQPTTGDGTGGMITKLMAARVATSAGTAMAIAPGTLERPIQALEQGGRCTWFAAQGNPRTARKQWIAGTLQPAGSITVDDGAVKALAAGKSLLPAGVTAVDGDFERGDAVLIKDATGRVLGRGLAAYSSTDAQPLMGHKSGEIETLLGYRGRDEMIHRDDLVLND